MTAELKRAYQLKERFNNISLSGFEGVLVGDVLFFPINDLISNNIGETSVRNILKCLKWCFKIIYKMSFAFVEFRHYNSSNTLFVFSSSYADRTDHKKAFEKVIGLFPESSCAIAQTKPRKLLPQKLGYIRMVGEWEKSIKESFICKCYLERLFILKELVDVFSDYLEAKMFFAGNLMNFKNLVTWCDVHPVDSYFTQMFNINERNTVDLMHGSIGSGEKWTVKGIKSKYFIADSKYTEDVLIRSGYDGVVYVCGFPYEIGDSINNEHLECNKKQEVLESRKIGVLLGAKGFHSENIELCNILRQLNGFHLFVKLHPTETKDMYPSECMEAFEGLYEDEIDSSQFMDEVSCLITMPSTVVFLALRREKPFLLIKDKQGHYLDFGLKEPILTDSTDIENRIQDLLSNRFSEFISSLREYYVAAGNVSDNYVNAFRSLGVN